MEAARGTMTKIYAFATPEQVDLKVRTRMGLPADVNAYIRCLQYPDCLGADIGGSSEVERRDHEHHDALATHTAYSHRPH